MVCFRRILQSAGCIAAFLYLTSTSFAGWGRGSAYFHGGHMMGGGYMGWLMIVFWVLLLLLLILVFWWILRLTRLKDPPQTALDILKQRLASGEIDIDEFKERKRFL